MFTRHYFETTRPAYSPIARRRFWKRYLVPGMRKGRHSLVLMDANARTGIMGETCADDTELGAHGRHTLNDNGRRPLAFSAEKQLALINTFLSAPKTWTLTHLPKSKYWTIRSSGYRLEYIFTRQTDRRLVRKVTVRRSSVAKRSQIMRSRRPVARTFCP